MFPSLVNCCTIDWFEDWPEDALLSVAQNSLKGLGEDQLVNSVATVCVTMHKVLFKLFITSSQYINIKGKPGKVN